MAEKRPTNDLYHINDAKKQKLASDLESYLNESRPNGAAATTEYSAALHVSEEINPEFCSILNEIQVTRSESIGGCSAEGSSEALPKEISDDLNEIEESLSKSIGASTNIMKASLEALSKKEISDLNKIQETLSKSIGSCSAEGSSEALSKDISDDLNEIQKSQSKSIGGCSVEGSSEALSKETSDEAIKKNNCSSGSSDYNALIIDETSIASPNANESPTHQDIAEFSLDKVKQEAFENLLLEVDEQHEKDVTAEPEKSIADEQHNLWQQLAVKQEVLENILLDKEGKSVESHAESTLNVQTAELTELSVDLVNEVLNDETSDNHTALNDLDAINAPELTSNNDPSSEINTLEDTPGTETSEITALNETTDETQAEPLSDSESKFASETNNQQPDETTSNSQNSSADNANVTVHQPPDLNESDSNSSDVEENNQNKIPRLIIKMKDINQLSHVQVVESPRPTLCARKKTTQIPRRRMYSGSSSSGSSSVSSDSSESSHRSRSPHPTNANTSQLRPVLTDITRNVTNVTNTKNKSPVRTTTAVNRENVEENIERTRDRTPLHLRYDSDSDHPNAYENNAGSSSSRDIDRNSTTELHKILQSYISTISLELNKISRKQDFMESQILNNSLSLRSINQKLRICDGTDVDDNMSISDLCPIDVTAYIPTKTKEDFENLDKKIKDNKEFYNALLKHLQKYRGTPNSMDYSFVLQQIVSDDVLMAFNLDGRMYKSKLKDLRGIMDLLLDLHNPIGYIDLYRNLRNTLTKIRGRVAAKRVRDKRILYEQILRRYLTQNFTQFSANPASNSAVLELPRELQSLHSSPNVGIGGRSSLQNSITSLIQELLQISAPLPAQNSTMPNSPNLVRDTDAELNALIEEISRNPVRDATQSGGPN